MVTCGRVLVLAWRTSRPRRRAGYSDALACVSYRDHEDEPKWTLEAQAVHRWRTKVWWSAHPLLAEVEAGLDAPRADEAELFARLTRPPKVWPSEGSAADPALRHHAHAELT